MKNLKIKFGLFSLLAVLAVSAFLTSCEQDIIAESTNAVSTETMLMSENITSIEEQLVVSKNTNEDCVKRYHIPFDDKIKNAEDASNYFATLSDEQKSAYFQTTEQIENRDPNDYCDPWVVYGCSWTHACSHGTCFILPYENSAGRECYWGWDTVEYCWFHCDH